MTRKRRREPRQPGRKRAEAPEQALRYTMLCPIVIVAAGLIAYYNSFSGVFLLDDGIDIVDSHAIRQPILSGGWLETMQRPLVTLSLAVNYRLGGLDVWGYHAVNLAIHILSALVLFGIVRRTLRLEGTPVRFREAATGLGLCSALLWLVHPLQTGSVTYIIQRCESMMGLFYLLTLYCVIRGATARRGRWWFFCAVASCIAGMASKAVMVTAPLMVLLYDRVFLTGDCKETLRRRWVLYSGLAATWLFLADGGLAGNLAGVVSSLHETRAEPPPGLLGGHTPIEYASAQPAVVLHYLLLCFWPAELCLDYVWPPASTWVDWLPHTIVLGGLLALTVWALVRAPRIGFLGAWLFFILAPTSSIRPLNNIAFEHRMYVPLAAVVTLAVCAVYRVLLFPRQRASASGKFVSIIGGLAMVVAAVALCALTIRRNQDYHSELAMWEDVVQKRPQNPRAHTDLGVALAADGRVDEAIGHYRQALAINARYFQAHNDLANALVGKGRFEEAMRHFESALRLRSDYDRAHNNLGRALALQGRIEEALAHFKRAVELNPFYADAHSNLGNALAEQGRPEAAIEHYLSALQLDPDLADAHNNLAGALYGLGRSDEAVEHYREAVRLRPDYGDAWRNLGVVLASEQRWQESVGAYRAALRINPADGAAADGLKQVESRLGAEIEDRRGEPS